MRSQLAAMFLISTLSANAQTVSGAIDMHAHADPDGVARKIDAVDLARLAKGRGMRGVQNVMVTHALTNPGGPLTLSEIEQAAKLGAYIELVYGGLSEDLLRRDAEVIRAVGASSVVLSTDLGQPQNPLHTDGLLAFYKGLMAHGISEAEIVQMSQTNPAKLLGLKP